MKYKKYIGEGGALNILIHGGNSSKNEWFETDGYTKGGNLTDFLERSGLSYLACDLYGHGDWKADEPDFSTENISDEYWNKAVENSVVYIMERIELLKENFDSINIISYSIGSFFAINLLEKLQGYRVNNIILCSPDPGREYNDEFSMHNNLDQLEAPYLTIYYGTKDKEVNTGDIMWVFNLVKSENKKLISYNCGHSLPADWVEHAKELLLKDYLK